MKRTLVTLLYIIMLACSAHALPDGMEEPARWHFALKMRTDTTGVIIMKAQVERGWHMYSNLVDPSIGPAPLTVDFAELRGVRLAKGDWKADPKPVETFDEMFGARLSWWNGDVTLTREFTATEPKITVKGYVRFQLCDNQRCLAPQKEEFALTGTAQLPAPAVAAPAETPEGADAAEDTLAATPAAVDTAQTAAPQGLWAPVTFDDSNNPDDFTTTSLWWIFGGCLLGGLLALFTPCVWPMIPLTVSYFLKKSKSRRQGIADACVYGISIIIIYVLLGTVVTMIFGADALNALATSAVCNIIFFVLLVVFAASFFGAFEITVPSGLVNGVDSLVGRLRRAPAATPVQGDAPAKPARDWMKYPGIFFMAFTLALVSFSCTGPIIGTLLVETATTGSKFGPMVGMAGFSLALALPFALFAMFPSWLKNVPRSGSWMETVKVVLGFLELALSLKFLSMADLAYGWHILDREAFLSLWIITFTLAGVYLLGGFRFHHKDEDPEEVALERGRGVGVGRFFLAMASLSFAVYLLPGLWGAPLKGVSAFVPPLYTQDFNLYGEGFTEYDDYEAGMAAAREQGKPAFVDFSGYGCVNCRKMEGAVLDKPEVRAMIESNFVVIKLMVDDKKALPQPMTVNEGGRTRTLDTYGEKWSYLQRVKFRANTQPYYVVLDAGGRLLSGPYSYDENVERFSRFLQEGMRPSRP